MNRVGSSCLNEADCYLSVYQKDAIINDEVPIRWTSYGNTWAACRRQTSKKRALFFCHDETDSWDGNPLDADDGDARMHRPAIVLGPNQAFRYALDLVSAGLSHSGQYQPTGFWGGYVERHNRAKPVILVFTALITSFAALAAVVCWEAGTAG